MQQYSFICPLPGCGITMSAHAQTKEQGVEMLVGQAHKHLADVHPDVHKTHEEITADITSHMVETKE